MATSTDRTDRETIVVENPALRRGFTVIPNYVLRNSHLSFGARLTYTLLLSYAWQDGACFPGQDKLALDLQSDPRSVRRYLTELRDQGLIRVERRGLGLTNVYILTDFRPPAEADGTALSHEAGTPLSAPDRTPSTANKYPETQELKTVNRLADEKTAGEARRRFTPLASLIGRRPPPSSKAPIVDKKLEVAPLAEAAARRLRAPGSLGMLYKVLLQLYPKHLDLFEEAIKEAVAEPKPRVSRSALFAHIVRRLADEYGVPLHLGKSAPKARAGDGLSGREVGDPSRESIPQVPGNMAPVKRERA